MPAPVAAGSGRPDEASRMVSEAEWYRRVKEWIDGIRQTNAWLRYLMKIEPDALSIEEWAMRAKELEYVREQEANKA